MYPFLRRSPVQTNPLGMPVVRTVNIKIEVQTGKSDYTIEENSPLERNYGIGLWVTKPGAKIDQTKTQVDGAIFDAAYIILRQQEANILFKLPFEHIRLANAQGRPYPISLPGPINLSESTIVLPENSGIAANTCLEFQVDYVKLDPKKVK